MNKQLLDFSAVFPFTDESVSNIWQTYNFRNFGKVMQNLRQYVALKYVSVFLLIKISNVKNVGPQKILDFNIFGQSYHPKLTASKFF